MFKMMLYTVSGISCLDKGLMGNCTLCNYGWGKADSCKADSGVRIQGPWNSKIKPNP